ncbi:NTP transferase domain-containing protein [Methanogenium sp. S4BF]|uniref:sugar phosphate nucleotidyltransferase n=1 Tax=Methanogenium sp. S4BF TaxID=1789226 RepID=UPI0024164165|nr:sugar phosphate nucleotidyltransferase [Methanogenium sp. S4BF]WFN34363.1 NTP transferase domain-containing protein [Methanogenium sp. S4BF]
MQAVVLAGGEGSRLRPLTRNRPKALIPVANRPIIEYVIEALTEAGVRDITVVVGYRKEQVIHRLADLPVSVNVAVQEKQLGVADALRAAEEHVSGRFLLLPGDNVITAAALRPLCDGGSALLTTPHSRPTDFGVVQTHEGFVREITEKPEVAESFTVSTGVFSLDPSVFRYYESGLEFPNIINRMIADGTKVRAHRIAGGWSDAVFAWELLALNRSLLKKTAPLCAGTLSRSATVSGRVSVGRGTEILPGTVITGPAIIGANCTIGPNACISPGTAIGSGVTIGPFSHVSRSIVMDDVTVGSHSSVRESVIGEGCRLADHTAAVCGEYATHIRGRHVSGLFGTIMGDRVDTAPFTVLKGAVVGNNVAVETGGRTITGAVPDQTVVM